MSEVVTNALRYTDLGPDGRIDLRVNRTRAGVRVEVRDPGPGFVPSHGLRPPPRDQAGGRGLVMVDKVADRWGVRRDPRTMVWFEIDAPTGAAGSA